MPFSDFPGFENVTRVLSRITERQSYHPAYLFHGPPGVGKHQLAHAFAKAILCPERKGDFCGQCSVCYRMEKGYFPDFVEIRPDGALIKIEQTREMIQQAAVHPMEARKKVFLLDPADRMKLETADSLLKVLEEPFEFSIFILITSNPKAILPTIDSRCQKIRVFPLPYDVLVEQLAERCGLSREAAGTLARISGGRAALAQEMAEGDFLKERDRAIELLASIAAKGELEVFRFTQSWRGTGVREPAHRFLQFLVPVLRDAALLKENEASPRLLNLDRRREILQATESFRWTDLVMAWQDATECTWNLLQNANVQAQLERVLLHLCPLEDD